MSSPSLGRLLISHITLRGPEIAQLYALIAAEAEITYEDLMDRMVLRVGSSDVFGLEEASAREALNFLLVTRLITQHGSVRRCSVFQVSSQMPEAPFALMLLHHLVIHDDVRQQAMNLVHRQLIQDDILWIDNADLRIRIERSTLKNLFTWTSEKLSLWASIYGFLGTLRRLERTNELILLPQPHLILSALSWAARLLDNSGSLGDYVHMIDRQLFGCLTHRGRLHQGTMQVLVTLQRHGQIELTHESDAIQSVLVGDRRISHVWLKSNLEG